MLTRRHMEVATGLVLAAFGAVVAYGSLEGGIGWSDLGPESGYFPFRIGVLVTVIGCALALRYGFIGRQERAPALAAADPGHATDTTAHFDERFFEPGSVRRLATVFVPTAIAAALIPWLGLYIGSVLFLVVSMRLLGKVPLWKAATISVGIMVAFFLVFEFWFQVPLAKGVLLPLVGIY